MALGLAMISWIWHQKIRQEQVIYMYVCVYMYDFTKIENFFTSKDMIKKKKRQLQNGRKYLQIL